MIPADGRVAGAFRSVPGGIVTVRVSPIGRPMIEVRSKYGTFIRHREAREVPNVPVRSTPPRTPGSTPARNIHRRMLCCSMPAGPELVQIPEERRRYHRYPIHLEVRYVLLHLGVVNRIGSGRTVNISTRGVLFEADGPLPDRGKVMLEMTWPFLLDGAHNLKLVVCGRIVRTDGEHIAVRFASHEFRMKASKQNRVAAVIGR